MSPHGYITTIALLVLVGATVVACTQSDKPLTGFSDATVVTPVVVIPPVEAGPNPAIRAAELQRANGWRADLRFLVAHKTTMSTELVSGEGDASAICDAATAARAKTADAEIARTLDEALGACAFDVPLLIAGEALDHLRTSTSQASVRLMCSVSAKEIAKAKAVRPNDAKVRQAEYRRSSSGRCH